MPLQPAAKKKQRLDVNGTAAATGGSGEGETTTVFVGNLPWSATEEQISGLFADCGEVTGVRIGGFVCCLWGCAGRCMGAGCMQLVRGPEQSVPIDVQGRPCC